MLLHLLLSLLLVKAGAAVTQIPISNYRDQVYTIPVTLGSSGPGTNQTLQAVLDTGSSDTWFASSTFQCANSRGGSGCRFGGGYARASSPSFRAIPGQTFGISYASESVEGSMGTETVALGNVSVEAQVIGVVERGVWRGDGISSGLVGMAFPSQSAVWYGFKGGAGKYSPVFTSMVRERGRLAAPVFSIALNGVGEAPGALTLGGLPIAGVIRFEEKFTAAKMRFLTFGNGDPTKAPPGSADPGLYRIGVDGFVVHGQTMAAKTEVTLDSGTAFNTLPKDVARAYNNAWVPKAKFDRSQGWTVDCNAKAPKLGIKINGVIFEVESKDLIIPPENEGSKEFCVSGVQEGGPMPGGLLGASFLKSVVAVFDVGNMEMRFANRIR